MTPWSIQPLAATMGADIAICEGSDIVAIMHHDPAIQTAPDPDGSSVVWSPEDLARARMLAGAPELLQLLEHIHYNGYSSEQHDPIMAALIARVRGAA